MKHAKPVAAIALPILLLIMVPFGLSRLIHNRAVGRAEHAPLTPTDRRIRAELGSAASLQLSLDSFSWQQAAGLTPNPVLDGSTRTLTVKDKASLQQIVAFLRCTGTWVKWGQKGELFGITGSFAPGTLPSHALQSPSHAGRWTGFYYLRDGEGSYFIPYEGKGYGKQAAVLQPILALRFEALIAQLAQRAQAPGHHPEVVLN